MATLTANKTRDYSENIPPRYESHPVVATDIIYSGAAVGLDSNGRAKPLAGTDDQFAGFTEQKIDNSTGAAGALEIRVRQQGEILLIVATVDNINDVAELVYMSDDDTATLVSTSNKLIGKVARVVDASTGLCWVAFQADAVRSVA